MPLLDRFKRKPRTELNPFTGQVEEIAPVTPAQVEEFSQPVKVVYEDRLGVAARWFMRAVAILTTAFNFLMLLGYITSVNIPFAIVFFFSTYFALVYLKRRRPVESVDR